MRVALHETLRHLVRRSIGDRAASSVPLARRNIFANNRRLVRSALGIAFAVLLMMVELGFRNAFIDSMLLAIGQLDADIVLLSDTKYQFDRTAPFSRRQLYAARVVPGVAMARPLYGQREVIWKNPQDHRTFTVQVFAFDPDQPVFLLPEVAARLDALRQPDTVMTDRRARGFLGKVDRQTETELARRDIHVVGTFSLGPSFFTNGTVLMSDRNFFKLLWGGPANAGDLPDVEAGIVRVLPGYTVAGVQRSLRAALPPSVSVLTKSQLMDREAGFHARVSPVGPIFGIGTLVGFAVGMMISYQILFSDLSEQLPQYATLKAMGYGNAYLVKVVLQQAVFYALVGYVPAWILCAMIFHVLGNLVLLPMQLNVGMTALSLGLTLVMCTASALIAVRRVIVVDPAEVF
jgi:putative ABC transport system permease protein